LELIRSNASSLADTDHYDLSAVIAATFDQRVATDDPISSILHIF
jgi:hypothetical protein